MNHLLAHDIPLLYDSLKAENTESSKSIVRRIDLVNSRIETRYKSISLFINRFDSKEESIVNFIAEALSEIFLIPVDDILNKTNKRYYKAVELRIFCCYFLRLKLHLTYRDIGAIFFTSGSFVHVKLTQLDEKIKRYQEELETIIILKILIYQNYKL